MSDEISVTFPHDREFFGIAHLVAGGLAVRLDLTLENLEDIQLGIAGLLEERDLAGTVTVALRVDGDRLTTRVGPVDSDRLRHELEAEGSDEVGLARVLATVADSVRIDGDQVELVKTVRRVGA